MDSFKCRFCRTTNKKMTKSINDALIVKFLDMIPKIVLSENQLFPVTVCNACYGKAQESFQFIGKINETQNKFENEVCWGKESNKVDVPVKSRELTEHILQKIKKYSAVSIQKLNPVEVVDVGISVKTEPIDSLDYLVEVDESGGMVNISSDSESSDSNHEADSDFEYRPHKKLKDEEKLKSKAQKMNKNFFIDAPINFTCAKCKTSFDDFCTLSRHMKQRACQSLAEIFECEICKKQFNIKRKLREHMRSHQPKLTVMCDGCGISFKSQAELDSHSEAIHRRVVKLNCTFRCAHCPETFNSHLDLLEHIKSHPKNPKGPPKLCEICAKECPSTESYRVHMIKHQDVLPYICDVCNKGFARKFLLIQHAHVHTGIKPYKCNVCKKSYAKKDSLRIHKNKHHANDSN